MSERDVGCLHAFSDFLDEIEDLNALDDARSATASSVRHRDKPVPEGSDEGCPPLLRLWLGMGWYGAECHATRHGSSCNQGVNEEDDDVLQLFADDASEDCAVAEQCAMVRNTIITELCGALIPKMSTLQFPTGGASSNDVVGFHHSLHRLVASQITRERWLYPLRFLLPQTPAAVARRVSDVFHHGVSEDAPMCMKNRLQDLSSLVDSIVAEVAFSPAKLLRKAFVLFETVVDIVVVHARLLLQADIQHLLQVRSNGCVDANDDSLLLGLVDGSVAALKSKLALLFHAASGSEVHWLFLTSLMKALQERIDLPDSRASTTCAAMILHVAWREVLCRLEEWLSLSSELDREHSANRAALSLEKFFGFGSIGDRRARLAEAVSFFSGSVASLRLVNRHELSHLVALPDALRWTDGTVHQQAAAGKLLEAMQPLLLGRNGSPKQPPWMASVDSHRRMMKCFDQVSWSSKLFGDTPEFPALLPESGCMTAERVTNVYKLLAEGKDGAFARNQVLSGCGVVVWEKFVLSASVVYPTIASQLNEPQRAPFLHALITFILRDIRAAPSSNVFDVNPYDIVHQFLTTVLPLAWDMDSVHRLRDSLRSYLDASTLLGPSSVVLGRFLDVVVASVMQCIVNNLVALRYEFEEQDNGERLDGTTCFATEDVDVLSGYLNELAEKVLCDSAERVDVLEEAPAAAAVVSKEEVPMAETPNHVGQSSASHWWSDGGDWGASTAVVSSSVLHPAAHHPHPRGTDANGAEADVGGGLATPHHVHSDDSIKATTQPLSNSIVLNASDVMPSCDATVKNVVAQHAHKTEASATTDGAAMAPPELHPPLHAYRLHGLLLPCISWLVGDILVPVNDGDVDGGESSRVLHSDAMMHRAVGLAVGQVVHALVAQSPTWSVATVQALTNWLASLRPSHCRTALLQSSDKRRVQPDALVIVNDVMRMGLGEALHLDSMIPCIIEPQSEDVLIRPTHIKQAAIADALSAEKGRVVKHFYEVWTAFTEWCH